MTLLLTNDDVEQVLDMPAALAALEPIYRELPEGRAVNRPQSQTYLPGPLTGSSYCLKTVEGGAQTLGVMAIRLTSDVLRAENSDGVERRVKGLGPWRGRTPVWLASLGRELRPPRSSSDWRWFASSNPSGYSVRQRTGERPSRKHSALG